MKFVNLEMLPAVLLGAAIMFIGYMIGYQAGIDRVEREAVDRGHAVCGHDKDGEEHLIWLDRPIKR